MASQQRVVLHASWMSSCSWRVRAALHYKGVEHVEINVDIQGPAQHQLSNAYRSINPAKKVPALEIDGVTIVESMAILQYLEETRPAPTLQPSTPLARARAREICELIVSGIQPHQNNGRFFESEEQFHNYARNMTDRGLQALEELLEKSSPGRYCIGNSLSIADLCFVPQVYNAVGPLELDINKYPTILKLYYSLLQEDIFKNTHPKNFKPKDLA